MPQPRRAARSAMPFESPRRIVVVVDPQAGFTAVPDGVDATAVDPQPVIKTLSGAKAHLAPLFGATEERVRHAAARQAELTGAAQPDLSVYYSVEAPEERLDDLAGKLLSADGVLGAYVAPRPQPPIDLELLDQLTPESDISPPATPDFTPRQTYLGPAPAGIDAQFAWTLPGGRGTGVGIVDIEGAWRFAHEDLLANQGGVVGAQTSALNWRNHGTAVVSEFGGDVNGFGVTGICPDANVRGFSVFDAGGAPAAIRAAADALNAGDVMLLELHYSGPDASGSGQDGYIAIEWWPAEFDAIRYATNKGVIVVEAAGNGARNLDAAIYNTPLAGFPPGWSNPFNRANRDSGAVIVGAGAPPPGTHGRDHGADRSRLGFSNWGSCVDAQGWGREVTACGYGDLQGGTDENLWYTDQFSGTSSASPIVVGAIGCIQGVRRAQGQALLTPAGARLLLRTTGSPQQDEPTRPATQRIGNRPNLRQVLGGKRVLKDKFEAKEHKDVKLEKNEAKERKDNIKERKEFKEVKLEKREGKDTGIDKHHALDKNERIEGLERKLVFENKLKDSIEGRIFEEGIREFERPASAEDRLAALEDAISQLAHFITGELRPDLGSGALSGEPDYGAWQAKSDLEKLGEGP